MNLARSTRATEDWTRYRGIVEKSFVEPHRLCKVYGIEMNELSFLHISFLTGSQKQEQIR